MLLGMVDDVIKINKWSLGQSGGVAGPETCKIAIFEAIKKNEKSKKSLQNWMESQGECTRVLSICFLAIRGPPSGGFAPLKKITSIHSR